MIVFHRHGYTRSLSPCLLFQVLPQSVSLPGISASFCHRRRPAAIPQNHALILKIDIPEKGFVMRRKSIKCPVVRVPCHREQSGFKVSPVEAAVRSTMP